MTSDKPVDYTEFEPEANEIMFGQKTLPDRSLTDPEKSERKKIILKLFDQKLKFELIDLLSQQQKKASTPNVLIDSDTVADSIPPNNLYSGATDYRQQNSQPQSQNYWKPQFQTHWQPLTYPEHYTMHPSTSWANPVHNFQSNSQHWQLHQKPSYNRSQIHHNANFYHPSTISSNSTVLASRSNNIVINISSDNKNETSVQTSSDQGASSLFSVRLISDPFVSSINRNYDSLIFRLLSMKRSRLTNFNRMP